MMEPFDFYCGCKHVAVFPMKHIRVFFSNVQIEPPFFSIKLFLMLNDFDLMVLPDSIIYAHFHTFARWHMHTNGKSCVTQKYLKEKNDLS